VFAAKPIADLPTAVLLLELPVVFASKEDDELFTPVVCGLEPAVLEVPLSLTAVVIRTLASFPLRYY
jgi:hypothetical protein